MRRLWAIVLLAAWGLAGADNTLIPPNQVVENTANAVARSIEGRQDELAANPKALYQVVNDTFLPVFDTDYAGRLVLGKHWRDATPDQRKRFIDTFYDFLLRSYAKAVLKFRRDNIRILPGQDAGADAEKAVVKTEMKLPDGTVLPVNYTLHKTDKGWLAYDVQIEGISYVQNYRNQFSAEIGANGIEAVITRLQNDAAKVDQQVSGAGPAKAK